MVQGAIDAAFEIVSIGFKIGTKILSLAVINVSFGLTYAGERINYHRIMS